MSSGFHGYRDEGDVSQRQSSSAALQLDLIEQQSPDVPDVGLSCEGSGEGRPIITAVLLLSTHFKHTQIQLCSNLSLDQLIPINAQS